MAMTLGAQWPARYLVGTAVEVFISYSRRWVTGFEIAGVNDDHYTLRRHSDWAVLPGSFSDNDIRPCRVTAPA